MGQVFIPGIESGPPMGEEYDHILTIWSQSFGHNLLVTNGCEPNGFDQVVGTK